MTAQTTATIRVTHCYAAAAERIFDAWLNPTTARRFLFATPTGQMVRAETDPRVGGQFTFVDRRDGEDIVHTGEYLELERPIRLVFSFLVPKYSSQSTRVSIEIVPDANGCELFLTHEGVLPEYKDRSVDGWSKILAALAAST